MKKLCLLPALILLCAFTLKSQDIEFKKIKWEDKPVVSAATEDQAHAGEVLFVHITIEYIYDEKGDLKRYYGLHKRIKINEEKFIQSVNKIYIPYNQKDIVTFKSRSISKSGAVKETGLDKLKEIEEDGNKYKIVAVEGIESGGEIEFMVCYQTAPKYYLAEHIQLKIPVREQVVEVISPENLSFSGKIHNAVVSGQSDTIIDKKRILKYQLNNIRPYEDEKYSAGTANRVRLDYKLDYNFSKSKEKLFTWGESGKKLFESLHIGQKESLKDIKKFISKTDIRNLSEEEKIFKFESMLKTDIAINEEAQSTENVGLALKNKFCNEMDITRLYLFLIEELGLKYELVVTCNRFDQKFDPAFETWDFLEEYLIYFPALKKFIDPVDRFSRLGPAPFANAGNNGLFIKPITLGEFKSGAASVKMIEMPEIQTQTTASEYEISLVEPEMLSIKYFQGMSGYSADSYRPYYNFTDETKKKELAEEIIKSILSEDIKIENMKVENYDINSLGEFSKPFNITASVSTSSLLEKTDKVLLVKIGEVIGPQTQMYNETPRVYPIELPFPHEYKRKIKLHIPEGYKLKGAEELKINIVFADKGKELFGFVSDYTIDNNILTADVHEYYSQTNYSIDQYEDFQKVINAAADFNKIILLFEKVN